MTSGQLQHNTSSRPVSWTASAQGPPLLCDKQSPCLLPLCPRFSVFFSLPHSSPPSVLTNPSFFLRLSSSSSRLFWPLLHPQDPRHCCTLTTTCWAFYLSPSSERVPCKVLSLMAQCLYLNWISCLREAPFSLSLLSDLFVCFSVSSPPLERSQDITFDSGLWLNAMLIFKQLVGYINKRKV